MHQAYASQPSPFLSPAVRTATRVNTMLEFSLEKALALTESDVGGIILLFDTPGKEPLIVASGGCIEFAEPAKLLKKWEAISGITTCETGVTPRVDDYRGTLACLPLLLAGRSSLSAPLMQARRVIGVIHVESSQHRHYRDADLPKLECLANEVTIAVGRLWLKEYAAKSGARLDVIGVSKAFLELEKQIKVAASYDGGPVVITGERGSGKELVAWALHCWSPRRRHSFVPVLASTFSEGLFADELFGHDRYAFTGALKERLGKFKAADGGTIFLDEVADMPMAVQNGLLRIVETGELSRIGRDLPIRVNVRVIAATNRDLPDAIRHGRFRQDLYDRLRVFEIRVPPLRERMEDIAPLASHFVRNHCAETQRQLGIINKDICAACNVTERAGCVASDVYSILEGRKWPGNVRELKSFVLRSLIQVPNEVLEAKYLGEDIEDPPISTPEPAATDLTLEAAIRSHIQRALELAHNNQSEAARCLGLPLSTLRSKMKKLGIKDV